MRIAPRTWQTLEVGGRRVGRLRVRRPGASPGACAGCPAAGRFSITAHD